MSIVPIVGILASHSGWCYNVFVGESKLPIAAKATIIFNARKHAPGVAELVGAFGREISFFVADQIAKNVVFDQPVRGST